MNHTSSGDVDQSSPGGDGDGVSPDHGGEDAGDLSSEEDEKGRMEGRWDDVRELLALIERDRILPPLRVGGCTGPMGVGTWFSHVILSSSTLN